MFTAVLDGVEIHVDFIHKKVQKTVGGKLITFPLETVAKIFAGDKLLGEGKSICSKKDNFSYDAGRKIALVRALDKAKINDKEERRYIWSLYFEAQHKKLDDNGRLSKFSNN